LSGDRYKIDDQNGLYFLTFTVVDWVDIFTRKEYCYDIIDSFKYCQENKGLVLYAWCIMSSHLHIICRAKEEFRLSDIIRDFKKFTAKRIIDRITNEPESRREWLLFRFEYAAKYKKQNAKYMFWKKDNHAVLLDNNTMMQQRLDYVHNNPVEAGIVDEPEQYVFSSARDYAGQKGMLDVEFIG
jgi:putative transposase